jgi:hypothetical protein
MKRKLVTTLEIPLEAIIEYGNPIKELYIFYIVFIGIMA